MLKVSTLVKNNKYEDFIESHILKLENSSRLRHLWILIFLAQTLWFLFWFQKSTRIFGVENIRKISRTPLCSFYFRYPVQPFIGFSGQILRFEQNKTWNQKAKFVVNIEHIEMKKFWPIDNIKTQGFVYARPVLQPTSHITSFVK